MDFGYHILTEQPQVVDFYLSLHKDDINGFHEYYRLLRDAFPTIDPLNYRGISRLPLLAVPEDHKSSWGTFEEPQAQFLMDIKIESTCQMAGDDEIDMLSNLEDCLEVFELIQNKSRYEIARVSKTVLGETAETIGFDVGYWGGDNFSAISDSILLPMWHGAQKEAYDSLRPFAMLLNKDLLFSSSSEATTFREFYLSQEWAETEISENQICVQRVELVR